MTHSPKTRAMSAYCDGLLSDTGSALLERHLAGCETCQAELSAIREYARLREGIRATEPAIDWSRVDAGLEASLRAERRQRARMRAMRWGAGGAVFAAAAAAIIWFMPEAPRVASRTEVPGAVRPTIEAVPVRLTARLLERVGDVQLNGRAPSTDPVDGGVWGTGDGSSALLALGEEGTTVRLGAATRTRLDAHLALEGGQLQVVARSSTLVVLAASHRIEIERATCVIELDATGAVRVLAGTEGAVRVDGELVVGTAEGRVEEPGGEPARRVDVTLDGAVRLVVGGRVVEGVSPYSVLAPRGALRLAAFDARGREVWTHSIDAGDLDLDLRPSAVAAIGRPVIAGHLDPEEIEPIVRGSQRALQHCYEQALRAHPDLGGGTLRARVSLDREGAVRRVRLDREQAPAVLEACVMAEAVTWRFPAPGGPVSFEIPLRFRSR